jgi:hypothetical protein
MTLFYNKTILLVKYFFTIFYDRIDFTVFRENIIGICPYYILYFEKLQKVTELFSWFNHSLSNSEENGMWVDSSC